MIDVAEILEHWYLGRPKAEVARSLGVDVKTVRKYVAAAEAAGLVPGGPPVPAERWLAMAREWKRRRCCHCRACRSSWPPGSGRRLARTPMPWSARPCTRCRGD